MINYKNSFYKISDISLNRLGWDWIICISEVIKVLIYQIFPCIYYLVIYRKFINIKRLGPENLVKFSIFMFQNIFIRIFSCYLQNVHPITSGHLVEPIRLGPENFACPYCTKTMRGRKDMQEHIFTHTGERPYSCFKCKATFRQKKACKTHIKLCCKQFVQ